MIYRGARVRAARVGPNAPIDEVLHPLTLALLRLHRRADACLALVALDEVLVEAHRLVELEPPSRHLGNRVRGPPHELGVVRDDEHRAVIVANVCGSRGREREPLGGKEGGGGTSGGALDV